MEGCGCFSTSGVPGFGFGLTRDLAAASVNETEAAFSARAMALSTRESSKRNPESITDPRRFALEVELKRGGRRERKDSLLAALVLAIATAVNRAWSNIAL